MIKFIFLVLLSIPVLAQVASVPAAWMVPATPGVPIVVRLSHRLESTCVPRPSRPCNDQSTLENFNVVLVRNGFLEAYLQQISVPSNTIYSFNINDSRIRFGDYVGVEFHPKLVKSEECEPYPTRTCSGYTCVEPRAYNCKSVEFNGFKPIINWYGNMK